MSSSSVWTPTGARPTTCRSARSTCSTTRCCASRSRLEHIKPRLLGHWGTTPGLNFVYAHLNRVIRARDLNVIYVTGPGHGGPALVANAYLEGTYTEVYPHIAPRRGGHAPAVPPVLVPRRHPEPRRARDARLDPRGRRARLLARARLRRRVRQPRPARRAASSATARPRPARWPRAGTPTSSSTRRRDGAVLPILHLNGYKIANPTVLARIARRRAALAARRLRLRAATSSRATSPTTMHQLMAADARRRRSTRSPNPARARATPAATTRAAALADDRPAHAQGLDRAEGWSTACRSRARGAPTRCRSPRCATNPEHLPLLEEWMRSYRPEELFDENGALVAELAALAPAGRAADERQPARQRRPAAARPRAARLPRLRGRRAATPARQLAEATRVLGAFLRDVIRANPRHASACSGPDETASNRLDARLRGRPTASGRRTIAARPTTTSRPTAG